MTDHMDLRNFVKGQDMSNNIEGWIYHLKGPPNPPNAALATKLTIPPINHD
jgi:hypothetical protein